MKYIIIQLSGGIGNQLFQLANAYQLSIDYSRKLLICNINSSSRNVYWESILSKFNNYLISIEKYRELKQKSRIYNWAMTRFEYKKIELDSNIDYYCIEGYYQSYKYFDKLEFNKLLDIEKNLDIPNLTIQDVAIHIRRTDYTKNNFHKVLSLNYYYNCFQILSQQINIINIYIFSDDLNWCRNNFKLSSNFNKININFISLKTDIEELIFMSKFNNIIIANSSFSWWAAYLNNNLEKKIFCPKHWFNNGCHLNTKDLRPIDWIIIDDDLPAIQLAVGKEDKNKFDKNVFNILSLGSACCMVQNIHDNVYSNLGPLYTQPDNATNFFDWLITDFKFITYFFENLMFKDDSFLTVDSFTFQDVNANPKQLNGGWSNVYRKVEFKDKDIGSIISLHDVKKENKEIPMEFIEKYKRRFERLYNKIKNHNTIHLMHCFDFQWLKPYFPLVSEIEKIFETCKIINPLCHVKIYFFIHPNYHDNQVFKDYKFIDNLELCFLKNKGFHADWKANNLTFDEFLKI
jgi:hypothetical protein